MEPQIPKRGVPPLQPPQSEGTLTPGGSGPARGTAVNVPRDAAVRGSHSLSGLVYQPLFCPQQPFTSFTTQTFAPGMSTSFFYTVRDSVELEIGSSLIFLVLQISGMHLRQHVWVWWQLATGATYGQPWSTCVHHIGVYGIGGVAQNF